MDWPAEIRSLSKTWTNALADHVGEINAGTCALYLWEDGDFLASCSVTRCDRLGWFLNEMLRPDDSWIALVSAHKFAQHSTKQDSRPHTPLQQSSR